jgi:CRISPR-associated exonuclease Cas4
MIYAENNISVKLGQITDESSYSDKQSLNIGSAVVDFVEVTDTKVIVNEVKKSSKMETAHKLQTLHYLWILYDKDIEKEFIGKIRYPKEDTITTVYLLENLEWYNSVKNNIYEIVLGDIPDIEWIESCKNCSMREFCHS